MICSVSGFLAVIIPLSVCPVKKRGRFGFSSICCDSFRKRPVVKWLGVIDLKGILKQMLHTAFMTMLVPAMLLSFAAILNSDRSEIMGVTNIYPPEQTEAGSEPPAVSVYIPVLYTDGEVLQMELEEYVYRVVLGEMPAYFDLEALKAQAVAARTYTLKCIEFGDRHPQGAVCTDYTCCQAYREPEDYLDDGGSPENVAKVRRAVMETAGQALYYGGELIIATYFASSGGMTEDSVVVWGESYPYLKPVASPGEQDWEYYGNRVTLTTEEFQERLGVELTGTAAHWFGKVIYTDGGGVYTMRIGARIYTGVELREIFGLRSTMFTVSYTPDSVTFVTRGYGHRVGLSQYGADAMAVSGSSYDEILAHYYPGTSLGMIDKDRNMG